MKSGLIRTWRHFILRAASHRRAALPAGSTGRHGKPPTPPWLPGWLGEFNPSLGGRGKVTETVHLLDESAVARNRGVASIFQRPASARFTPLYSEGDGVALTQHSAGLFQILSWKKVSAVAMYPKLGSSPGQCCWQQCSIYGLSLSVSLQGEFSHSFHWQVFNRALILYDSGF